MLYFATIAFLIFFVLFYLSNYFSLRFFRFYGILNILICGVDLMFIRVSTEHFANLK